VALSKERSRDVLDKLHDWLDLQLMRLLALWAMFVTLPSLDRPEVTTGAHGETITMYPSRGTPGSCYCTADGQHYVRTGRGVRKIGKVLGAKLIARSKSIRRKAIARRVVFVLFVVICAASLVALKLS
jgi:hypothetical protein